MFKHHQTTETVCDNCFYGDVMKAHIALLS